ncbi:hypothetical protein [Frondihabitans cladoniiphilus]|uniref:Uncharacterized protein n=1 Tax=Frondihabitans cladoniiphilus TaxID=715785 RepID=A0ABP8VKW9_9MICO
MLDIILSVSVVLALAAFAYFGGRSLDRMLARRALGRGKEQGWLPSVADARALRRVRRELDLERRAGIERLSR